MLVPDGLVWLLQAADPLGFSGWCNRLSWTGRLVGNHIRDNSVSEPVYIKTNRKLCVLGLSFTVYAQRGFIDFWSDLTLMDVVMTTIGHLWTIWKAFLKSCCMWKLMGHLNVSVHNFSCNDIFVFNPNRNISALFILFRSYFIVFSLWPGILSLTHALQEVHTLTCNTRHCSLLRIDYRELAAQSTNLCSLFTQVNCFTVFTLVTCPINGMCVPVRHKVEEKDTYIHL